MFQNPQNKNIKTKFKFLISGLAEKDKSPRDNIALTI